MFELSVASCERELFPALSVFGISVSRSWEVRSVHVMGRIRGSLVVRYTHILYEGM